MKPTKLQLADACRLDVDDINPYRLVRLIHEQANKTLTERQLIEFHQRLISPAPWVLPAVIISKSFSLLRPWQWSSQAVPIEPFESPVDVLLAMSWMVGEDHEITLAPKPGAPNLLAQAYNAGVQIDRFTKHEVRDLKSERPPSIVVRDKSGQPRDFEPWATKTVSVLDKGSVLLAFELAGLHAPRDYDVWRKPDGDKVPLTATMVSFPALGTMTVHYTDGESALVVSGDQKRAAIVNVKKMVSAAATELAGFLSKNPTGKEESKPAVLREKAPTSDEMVSLFAAFVKKGGDK